MAYTGLTGAHSLKHLPANAAFKVDEVVTQIKLTRFEKGFVHFLVHPNKYNLTAISHLLLLPGTRLDHQLVHRLNVLMSRLQRCRRAFELIYIVI